MHIQAIGARAIALFASREEVPKGKEREVLKQAGLDESDFVEVEVYSGKDEVMVFAVRMEEATSFFIFDELETLLNAVQCLRECVPSELIYLKGRYILVLFDAPPLALCDFGEMEEHPQEYLLYLREQGRSLLKDNAIEQLIYAFNLSQRVL